MLIALMSDIHGNREAFDACLNHARRQGAARYIILGDLVVLNGGQGLCSHLAIVTAARHALLRGRSVATAAFGFILGEALLPLPDFWITQLNYIALYSLVVLGLVLLTGIGGLTSFGQAAFVGIGAYTSAYLTVNLGFSPWVTVFAGLAITAVSALLVGWITLRMSGHYLPLATIAWGLSLYYLMGNLDALGKYDGILGIPPLKLMQWDIGQGRPFFVFAWTLVLLGTFALLNLLDSRTGRAIRALRGRFPS